MTINKDALSLFNSDLLQEIRRKFGKTLINSKTKGRSEFTHLEIYKTYNPVISDNIKVYDIYCSQEHWHKHLQKFHGSIDSRSIITFNYFNYFLDKNIDNSISTYKIIKENTSQLDMFSSVCVRYNKIDIDPSSFSCKTNLNKTIIETNRIRVCDRAPIFIEFINNKTLHNTYYIKLVIEINQDIDVVLEELG